MRSRVPRQPHEPSKEGRSSRFGETHAKSFDGIETNRGTNGGERLPLRRCTVERRGGLAWEPKGPAV